MPNYQLSKIYKIVSDQTTDVYIGSTSQPRLCLRMLQHRKDYKKWDNCEIGTAAYLSSFEIMKYDDAQIILIENFPCNNKDELRAREDYYIKNTNFCINVRGAIADKDYQKKYDESHKDEKKKYYQQNKEQILESKKNNEKIIAYQKAYREKKKALKQQPQL